jgi:hypothetical protein
MDNRELGNHDEIKFDASFRAKFLLQLLKYLRPYAQHKKLFLKSINMHNLYDSIEIFFQIGDFEDANKALDWLQIAEEDLKAAKILYYGKHTPQALYHLQQCVEKLLKATLLHCGFRNEEQVKNLNHRPQNFLLTLLEDEKIKIMLGEKYPFTHIKLPGKYDENKLKKLKHNINDKNIMIKEQDIFIKFLIKNIEDGPPLMKSSTKWYDAIMEGYEKINPSERKKLNSSLKKSGFDFDVEVKRTGTMFWIFINFIYILFPLSITCWVFESITRYPDERRNIDFDLEDLELVQNFEIISGKLTEYLEICKNSMID